MILLEISMFVSRFKYRSNGEWGQHSYQPAAFIYMCSKLPCFLMLLTAAQEILNGVMYRDCRL